MTVLSNEDQELISKLCYTAANYFGHLCPCIIQFLHNFHHNRLRWIHWDISSATNTNLQEIVKYITKGKQNFIPSKCPWLLQIWVSGRFQYIYILKHAWNPFLLHHHMVCHKGRRRQTENKLSPVHFSFRWKQIWTNQDMPVMEGLTTTLAEETVQAEGFIFYARANLMVFRQKYISEAT